MAPSRRGKWRTGRRTAPSPQEVLSLSLLSRAGTTWPGSASTAPMRAPCRRSIGQRASRRTGNFGDAVQVDLYIDPAWQGNATRAGIWVFDQDFPDTSAYGIIEFANVRPPLTGAPGTGWTEGSEPFEGFRIWDSEAPVTMVNLPNVDFTYGEWVTFRIEVDPVGHVYRYLIDGVEVAVVSRGAAQGITQVILNSFNFGANNFPKASPPKVMTPTGARRRRRNHHQRQQQPSHHRRLHPHPHHL